MKKLSKRKVKQRRKVGIVKAYMSRAVAVKKLQVSLADFRRLCIMKGVYPVEPKNKSKLTGANTRRKTYFFTRDIQMLMNEPLLYKFWEFKVFMKRLTKAKGRHDLEKFNHVIENKPFYKLDEIVKERYPRFIDALRDCDDALSMCFLFAMFPKGRGRPDDLIDLSRKLTIEFMHYVINSKSLRKVFISIKGYYYQADIMNQTITWVVPHQFVIDRVSNVDLNVMKTFTEFYVTLLGFLNYKLYKSINAVYPPQIVAENLKDLKEAKGILDDSAKKNKQQKKRKAPDDEEDDTAASDTRDDLIGSLNKKIRIMENKSLANAESSDQQLDKFEEFEQDKSNAEGKTKDELEKMTVQQIIALEQLFDGLKFFLNREVPRESLTFIIRSFGGEVSWDKNLFPGATFDESDPTITHQIVDRSSLSERQPNRVYIQPQWVFDSINMRMLLPTAEYLMGATLPPHLSPFVNEKRGDYVPPDKIKLQNLRKQFEAEKATEKRIERGEAGVESDLETDTEFERATASESEISDTEASRKKLKVVTENDKNDIDSFDSKRSRDRASKNRKKRERDSNKSNKRSKMSVKAGKLSIEDKEAVKRDEDAEHRKMGIMMIPKKKKRLFDKITRTQKQKSKKTEKLRVKRRIVDAVKSRQTRSKKSR